MPLIACFFRTLIFASFAALPMAAAAQSHPECVEIFDRGGATYLENACPETVVAFVRSDGGQCEGGTCDLVLEVGAVQRLAEAETVQGSCLMSQVDAGICTAETQAAEAGMEIVAATLSDLARAQAPYACLAFTELREVGMFSGAYQAAVQNTCDRHLTGMLGRADCSAEGRRDCNFQLTAGQRSSLPVQRGETRWPQLVVCFSDDLAAGSCVLDRAAAGID